MKTMKDLTVTVTYTVGLCDVEVPNHVYDALIKCYDRGGRVHPDDSGEDEQIALEWLGNNMQESDAMSWEYEIDDLVEEE